MGDGHHVTATNVAEDERGRTMSLFGVILHVLSQSDRFDLRTRRPALAPAHVVEEAIRRNGARARTPHRLTSR